jgi:hypothetical protein
MGRRVTPLRAGSVSTLPPRHGEAIDTRLTLRLVDLPMREEGCASRIRLVTDTTRALKAMSGPSTRVAQLMLGASSHNLTIARLPGPDPQWPFYFAGRELRSLHPVGVLAPEHGLSISAIPYRDHLHVGFIADPDIVDDVSALARNVADEFDALLASTKVSRRSALMPRSR